MLFRSEFPFNVLSKCIVLILVGIPYEFHVLECHINPLCIVSIEAPAIYYRSVDNDDIAVHFISISFISLTLIAYYNRQNYS